MAHLKLNTKQWLALGEKLGYIKKAQEENQNYDYQWFWEELTDSSALDLKGNINLSSSFDKNSNIVGDETGFGTETISVSLNAAGTLECPATWLQQHSIDELENKINSDLQECRECYMECFSEDDLSRLGLIENLWDKIGCSLSSFKEIYQPQIEHSYCRISIQDLTSINETQAKISIHIEAAVEASGNTL